MPNYSSITAKEIRGDIIQALEAGVNLGWLDNVSMDTQSDSASEKYGWLGQVPGLREWKGSRSVKQLLEQDYTITNKHYESTIEFPLADLNRDKTGQMARRISELPSASNDHWVELVTDLIENYSSYTCYDGQAFFSATHSEGDSGTQLNLLTSTQAEGLDVTTATAPTAAECAIALLDVVAYMQTYKDDQGRPINRNVSNFVVVTGNVKLYSPLLQAAKSLIINSGGAAVDNIIKNVGLNFEVVFNPFLTASSWTTAFTIYRADAPVAPFILQSEKDINVKTLAAGSDWEFENDSWLFGLDTWRNAGYGFWQYAAHCTFS